MIKVALLVFLFCMHSTSYAMSVKSMKTRAPASKENKYPFFEFLELKQFPIPNHKEKFDLSSLVYTPDKTVYAISDKERNRYLYKVDWATGTLIQDADLGISDKMDIEAIDVCEDTFYLSNEKTNKFYTLKKGEKAKTLGIDVTKNGIRRGFFSGNVGFEGMAIDCKNQIMYAAKERQPRFILTIDLKEEKILKQWNIPETDAFDFSEAKFQDGYLYLLERTGMLIAKVDPKTEKVVAKYSYRNLEKNYGYLYGPAVYSFAEGLALTPDEIWIGFDNNGLKTTKDSQKDLGLEGRKPLIMRFKRPEGF